MRITDADLDTAHAFVTSGRNANKAYLMALVLADKDNWPWQAQDAPYFARDTHSTAHGTGYRGSEIVDYSKDLRHLITRVTFTRVMSCLFAHNKKRDEHNREVAKKSKKVMFDIVVTKR